MEKSIQIFNNPQFGEIRTAGSADNPMFCLADVCKVLDLQVTPTKNRLKQDGVNSIKVIDNLGREQNAIFVNEQNLYKVIMRSDKPQAEPFQDWVCGEVLPSIRKTGGYLSAGQGMTDEEIMARALQIGSETIRRREERIRELESDAREKDRLIKDMRKGNDYLNSILRSRGTVTATQIAQDYGMSARAFNKMLCNMRIQRKVNGQWILYGQHQAKGYVHSSTVKILHRDGTPDVRMQTNWTQRGRLFLYDALKEAGTLPMIERGCRTVKPRCTV